MDTESAVRELEAEFPGADIDRIPPDNPRAVVCHVHPACFHPDYSMDVAIIDEVTEHFHSKTYETVRVVRGHVVLSVNNLLIGLDEQQQHTIHPPTRHGIRGNAAKIEMTYVPGWSADDHFPVDPEPPGN